MLIEIEWHPDRRRMRNFAWTMLVAFPLFGGLLAWRFHAIAPMVLCAALGAVFWAAALFVPPVGLWIYKAWMGIGYALGLIVAPIVIALIYYAVVTPIALVLRTAGKDPMQRRCRGATSYWLPVQHRTEPASYRRQF